MNQPFPERGTLGEGDSTTNLTAAWIWPKKDDKDVAVRSLQHPVTQIVPKVSGTSQLVAGSTSRYVMLVNGSSSECNRKRRLVGTPPGWNATNCTGTCKYHNRTVCMKKTTCMWMHQTGGGCKDKCEFDASTNTCVDSCSALGSAKPCTGNENQKKQCLQNYGIGYSSCAKVTDSKKVTDSTTCRMTTMTTDPDPHLRAEATARCVDICDNHRDRQTCEDFPGSLCVFENASKTCVDKCHSKQNASSCDAVTECNYDVHTSTCVDKISTYGPQQSDGVGAGVMFDTIFDATNSW